MRHEQTAKFALGLFRCFDRSLPLTPCVLGIVVVEGDLSLRRNLSLLLDQICFLMCRCLDFIGRSLREHQRILQRLFHRLKVANAFFEIGYVGFKRGASVSIVFKRFNHVVEKLIDFSAIVSLQRFLERLVLYIYRRNFLHVLPPVHKVEQAVVNH